ncbi:MAG: DUF4013 domain-containing protein [Rhodobacter sp.]|nr:DUF4013 domain-containing protein [Rhodobacter sp.]
MTAGEAPAVPRAGILARALRCLIDLILGTLLCLTPVTAILALGWLMRRMRVSTLRRRGQSPPLPGWILGPRSAGWPTSLLGGLAANIREGAAAVISLSLATLPFSFPWLLAWWAGWDNSFNKGYEQAFAGPALFFFGIAIFLAVMIHLPMALAHQAATSRWLAVFELREVRRSVRHTGWGHVLFAFTTVFFALPLFASRGLPVFVEGIIPGFADFTPEHVQQVENAARLAVAAYVFASYWWLRTWSARLYAAAQKRAEAGQTPARTARAVCTLALIAIWFALVVLIVVAQFLNHSWWAWALHPAFGLPWYG